MKAHRYEPISARSQEQFAAKVPKPTWRCEVHDILLAKKWTTKQDIESHRALPSRCHGSLHPTFPGEDFHEVVGLALRLIWWGGQWMSIELQSFVAGQTR